MSFLSGKRVVDLTRTLRPGAERFKLDIQTFPVDNVLPGYPLSEEDWYILQEWQISSHLGTHVETPYHHIKDGADAADLRLEQVMGDALVLDFRAKKAGETIEWAEMEAAGSDVRPGDIVLLHTGFDRMYGVPDLKYDRPYLSMEAARWLVERQVACVGVDASGIEKYYENEQPVHVLLLGNEIPIIEELTHLDQLRRQRVFFLGLPLPIQGADACPIRAVAIEGA